MLTFPALLAFGMPAIRANATSTVALLVGIIGSAYGFREHLPAAAVWIRRFGLVSVIGGFLGALLLTMTPAETFEKLVPFLLLFASVLFMAQNVFGRIAEAEAAAHTRHGVISVALQFLVALYGGYFGAGIGILMLAVFGLMGLHDIHEMNTLKTVLSALINLVGEPLLRFLRLGGLAAGHRHDCGFHAWLLRRRPPYPTNLPATRPPARHRHRPRHLDGDVLEGVFIKQRGAAL